MCLNTYYIFTFEMKKGHLHRQPLEQKSLDTSFSCLLFFVPPLVYSWFQNIHLCHLGNSSNVFIVISTRVCANAIVPAAARAKGLDINLLLICVYKWIIFYIHLHWHFIHFFHYGFEIFMFIISPILRSFFAIDIIVHIYILCILVVW